MFVDSNNGDARTGLVELELYDEVNGPNIADTASAYSASSVQAFTTADAFNGEYRDGDSGSGSRGWVATTGSDEWLQVDFGLDNEKAIIGLGITSRGSTYGPPQAPNTFRLQYSNDATSWTDLFSESGVVFTNDIFFKFWEPSVTAGGLAATPHGDHAYWRLFFWCDSDPAIGEVEFRATAGGADQCSGGTPTASSVKSATYPASAAFNNDGGTTLWSADTNHKSAWLAYTFASPVAVAEVAITARGDGFASTTPERISIQYSDDGADWTTAWGITSQYSWGVGETRVFLDTVIE